MNQAFEYAHLALQLGLDLRPGLGLSSIGEKVHDNGGLANGLINAEQVLSGDPAVVESLLPGLAVLSYTDNDVEAVVAHVETLAVALGAIADEGKGVVLEVLLAQLSAPCSSTPNFDANEAVADSQEASLWANRHALYARQLPPNRRSLHI